MAADNSSRQSIIWIMLSGLFFVLCISGAAAYLIKDMSEPTQPKVATSRATVSEPLDVVRNQADYSSTLAEKPLTGAMADSSHIENPIETDAERSSRRVRETLGIQKRKPAIHAVDVELILSQTCIAQNVSPEPVSILYRYESPMIRGSSMTKLRELVGHFRNCRDASIQMTSLRNSNENASQELTAMRLNELKYFFTQNSVPKTALIYPVAL